MLETCVKYEENGKCPPLKGADFEFSGRNNRALFHRVLRMFCPSKAVFRSFRRLEASGIFGKFLGTSGGDGSATARDILASRRDFRRTMSRAAAVPEAPPRGTFAENQTMFAECVRSAAARDIRGKPHVLARMSRTVALPTRPPLETFARNRAC